MSINELKYLTRYSLGAYGEKLVASLLHGRVDHKAYAGDLECGVYGRVEVKTSIITSNRNSRVVRFCIHKDDKYGKTVSYNSDHIAFVIVSLYGDSVFVVPRCHIAQKHICMSPENFACRFTEFRIL